MEEEIIVSGYCRALDQSRMVTLEWYNGQWEADCAWPDCPHAPQCKIGQKMEGAVRQNS